MQGSLVQTSFIQLHDTDVPMRVFSRWEKRTAGHRPITCLWLLDDCLTTNPAEIWKTAVSFYGILYLLKACDVLTMAELHRGLHHLTCEAQCCLDAPLSLQEFSVAVEHLSPAKAPGIHGLSSEFYKHSGLFLVLTFFSSSAGMYPGERVAPH